MWGINLGNTKEILLIFSFFFSFLDFFLKNCELIHHPAVVRAGLTLKYLVENVSECLNPNP